jgi:hypothetical protein
MDEAVPRNRQAGRMARQREPLSNQTYLHHATRACVRENRRNCHQRRCTKPGGVRLPYFGHVAALSGRRRKGEAKKERPAPTHGHNKGVEYRQQRWAHQTLAHRRERFTDCDDRGDFAAGTSCDRRAAHQSHRGGLWLSGVCRVGELERQVIRSCHTSHVTHHASRLTRNIACAIGRETVQ